MSRDNYNDIEDAVVKSMSLHDGSFYNVSTDHSQGTFTVDDYYELPDDQRVELIDGYFYDMSAPTPIHQRIIGKLYYQIADFIEKNKGNCIPLLSPVDVQLDKDDYTMVQPDIIILCNEELMKSRFIYGAPDFVLEVISPSTKKKDYIKKLIKYEKSGVREYWILDPYQKKVIVYFFESDICPIIYGFDQPIPINIYDGKLVIDLSSIAQWT